MFSHTSPLWALCPNIHRCHVARTRRPGRRKSSRTSRQSWRSMNSEAPISGAGRIKDPKKCAGSLPFIVVAWMIYDYMMEWCVQIYIYTHTHTCIQYSLCKEVSMRFNEELNHVFNEDFHHSRGVNQQCLDHIWWQNDCYICTWSIYGIIDGIYLMILIMDNR